MPDSPATSTGLNRRYLPVQDLRRLRSLFFASRRIVEGLYTGRHASPQRGHSVEFNDYRECFPGAEIGGLAKILRAAVLLALLAVVAQLSGCASQSEMLQSRQPDAKGAKTTSSKRAVVAQATEREFVLDNPGGEQAVFSGDGSRLLLAGEHEAQAWDTATWKRIGPVIKLGRESQFVLDEEGKRVLITHRHIELDRSGRPNSSAFSESFVWDVNTGKRLSPVLKHKQNSWSGVALSPDGKLVARIGERPEPRVGAHQPVVLLHADTLTEFRNIADPMPWPHPRGDRALARESSYFAEFNPERVTSVNFQRDGSLLVIGSHGSVHKWDVENAKVRTTHEFSRDRVEAVTDNGRVLLEGIGRFTVCELATGRELTEGSYYKYDIHGVDISDDGALVAASLSSPEWGSEIWDVNSGRQLAFLPQGITLHPRGGMVAASTGDAAGVWDVVSGKCIRKPKTEGYYTQAVFSPDGSRLVLTGSEGTVILLARPGVKGVEAWK